MKISKKMVAQIKRIPTRFDDITREIYAAKTVPYFKQFKTDEPIKNFRLGEVFADKLNAIKQQNSGVHSLDELF